MLPYIHFEILQLLSGSSCSSGLDWWKFIIQRHRPRCGKPCDQPGMRYLNGKQWNMYTCTDDSLVHWTFSNRMATNMRSCVDMTSTRHFGFAGWKILQSWTHVAIRSWWFLCFFVDPLHARSIWLQFHPNSRLFSFKLLYLLYFIVNVHRKERIDIRHYDLMPQSKHM